METTIVFETSYSVKADQVEALFKSNDIIYERLNYGTGPHLVRIFGVSTFSDIKIAVCNKDVEKARDLLLATGYISE